MTIMLAVLDIGNYTEGSKLVLTEVGKYFAVVLFSVLAIRLWRRWIKTGGLKDIGGLVCALIVTLLALGIGYFSMRQSLGSMYSHYGMNAFRDGRVPQALALFETADGYWSTADTVGPKGVCLMLLGDPDKGRALIAQARTLRKADSQFEDFYEGIYLFSQGETDKSLPFLTVASSADEYRWSVIKIFSAINVDAGDITNAQRLMQPFMQIEVTEPDHAYVMAGLKLADGKPDEARALLNRFPETNLPAMWQSRYAKLRTKLPQ
jgi:hypothetical protein